MCCSSLNKVRNSFGRLGQNKKITLAGLFNYGIAETICFTDTSGLHFSALHRQCLVDACQRSRNWALFLGTTFHLHNLALSPHG